MQMKTILRIFNKEIQDDKLGNICNLAQEAGEITLTSDKNVPSSIEELFRDWHGQYHIPEDLKDWQNIKSEGKELW